MVRYTTLLVILVGTQRGTYQDAMYGFCTMLLDFCCSGRHAHARYVAASAHRAAGISKRSTVANKLRFPRCCRASDEPRVGGTLRRRIQKRSLIPLFPTSHVTGAFQPASSRQDNGFICAASVAADCCDHEDAADQDGDEDDDDSEGDGDNSDDGIDDDGKAVVL